ncbi:hypothetical protein DXG03_009460 [Asterophora parasitica]|uniref:Uncharacterized protein n=1 Tax=Asterophora parasitica TaxID=117018 RepID=A0A9P7GF47_9AGAR|nr:hypothetical protein DXG03_009460 [Asterophora parasitica]
MSGRVNSGKHSNGNGRPFTAICILNISLGMQFDAQDDVYAQNSHFLSASPRKSPTRQNVKNRKSSSSLRGPGTLVVDDDAANGRHSLAHELAVALMPEPSAGSRLLAEEFGIEYDEGAEGIDEDIHANGGVQIVIDDDTNTPSFASELTAASFGSAIPPSDLEHVPPGDSEYEPVFGGGPSVPRSHRKERPQQDAMELLAQDLESTDKLLAHLRTLDVDPTSSGTQQPALERLASDVIRRINETSRDREGQVRELLEYEREFRKIAGEVGGSEALGLLEELSPMDDMFEDKPSQSARPESRHIMDIIEEESSTSRHRANISHDWETDPDRLGDEDDEYEPVMSPIKDSFPAPPPITGEPTPAKTIPQLAHLRSFTASLVTSLATISEQAQVNGAATTEAGRKIRALKNKLGGWRTDWDSAERSRLKIDRWEAGILDGDEQEGNNSPTTPTLITTRKRVDGRRIVEEHLHAFELALADAAVKTQAIMTVS